MRRRAHIAIIEARLNEAKIERASLIETPSIDGVAPFTN
jgi:hypothetical protein